MIGATLGSLDVDGLIRLLSTLVTALALGLVGLGVYTVAPGLFSNGALISAAVFTCLLVGVGWFVSRQNRQKQMQTQQPQ